MGPLAASDEPMPQAVNESVPPPSDNYPLTADSRPQAGVAVGVFFEFPFDDSKVFPSTHRMIHVYVPAGYRGDPAHPACLMVFPDGIGYHATTVFDNLIARGELPVTIAVGITPGAVASAGPITNPRFDRSFELDSMTDRFPRFVIEEVLPAVEQHSTKDGRRIYLSRNPDDRGVAGSSTGGIAAFNLAWQRSDSFHRVFTSIGTFVGMRGGERYYVLVRKSEPKPLRVFMEDGAHDVCIPEIGDWFMSNQTMVRALEFAGYAVNHAWGVGTHNTAHAAAIFPDAMRWLWKDWPAAVVAQPPANHILQEILRPGEGWTVAQVVTADSVHLTADRAGRVSPGSARATGSDGSQHTRTAFPGLNVQALTVRNNGDAYATVLGSAGDGELWLRRKTGQSLRLDGRINGPGGLAFSPDGQWLFVAQSHSRWGLSYRVLADGTVDARESFFDCWVPDSADDSGAGDVCMDLRGYAYAATRVGVQIFDRNGRVLAIIPLPDNEAALGICFGGENFDSLFVASATHVYRRKLRVSGALPWAEPMVLPKWSEG